MNEERWLPVKGYEGFYEVSNLGRVRGVKRKVQKGNNFHILKEKILKQHTHRKGYKEVHLCKDGKERIFKVHRLVAMAFIPNPNNYPQINHKDEDEGNNVVQNLEWCTQSYNINYGERNKRLSEKVGTKVYQYSIDGEFIVRYSSIREAARVTGVKYPSILNASKRKDYHMSAGGYVWLLEKDLEKKDELISKFKERYSKQHKPIIQYDVNGEIVGIYNSRREAHIATNIPISTIGNYLNNRRPCPNGIWKYAK